MSSLVFPTSSIPGFSISLRRTHVTKTTILEAVSGKEWRHSFYAAPRYKYEISFEFLRNSENYRELNRVFDFLSKHSGSLDSFLLDDPEDDLAFEEYLGSGDHTALVPPTYFQLQRVLRASVQGYGGGQNNGHPIINYCFGSSSFVNPSTLGVSASPWTISPSAAIQDFAGVAPDGSLNAGRLTNSNGYGPEVGISWGATSGFTNIRRNQPIPSAPFSFSMWVRALSTEGPNRVGLRLHRDVVPYREYFCDGFVLDGDATVEEDPTIGRAGAVFTLRSTKWTRIGVSMSAAGQETGSVLGRELSARVYLDRPYSEILIWGGQMESGSERFSKHVPAMTSGITSFYGVTWLGLAPGPASPGVADPPITVWPGIGSGSEPVFDPRPCAIEEFGEQYPGRWGAGRYQPLGGTYNVTAVVPAAGSLDWQGKRAPSVGKINFIRSSLDFSQSAAWTAAAAGSGSPSAPTFLPYTDVGVNISPFYGLARGPDGSEYYGNQVTFAVGSGTTSATTSSLTQTVDHPLLVQGETYTFSVWAYPWDIITPLPGVAHLEIVENTSGASTVIALDTRSTILDSRASLVFTAGATCSITIRYRGDFSAALGLSTLHVLMWGAQLERGAGADWFLPTQAAAVMADPEIRDNQPSIYLWDEGMHSYGTLLSPMPRVNLCNGSWSTGSNADPDNPAGEEIPPSSTAGSVSGTSFASGIPNNAATYAFGNATLPIFGAMVCSSIYVRAWPGSPTSSTFTFGLRRDTTNNTTTDTVDFDPIGGKITRAGSRVVSAYAAALPDYWFRLVVVTTWDNNETSHSPMVSVSGAACKTFRHVVEPGRFPGSPFLGSTWAGDYSILTGPTTEHPDALPGTVLFPGDTGWIPSAATPKLGQHFTWSGGYYKRVRVDGDETDANRSFADRIWEIGQLNLISVKP